jgi:5-methylcytosine-specific restriction protein A
MQLSADDGAVFDAEYRVEPEGKFLALILESWSGGKAGSRRPRNPDYNPALTTLLTRLAHLEAVMVDALVDSRQTLALGLPEAERRIIAGPVRLKQQPDLNALRRQMGTAQSKIGQSLDAKKPGNSTKRIRLRLEVPGYLPQDADRLAEVLATSAPRTPTFILTWNPDRWAWAADEYARAVQVTAAGESWNESWSVGLRTGGIVAGNRALLLRQKRDRGIVASGVFTSGLEADEHWDGSGRPTMYAPINWDTVLEVDDRLPVEMLKDKVSAVHWDRIQGSGVAVPASSTQELAKLWSEHTRRQIFHSPDDLSSSGGHSFPEGALTRVEVNRYERDRRVRKACLDHWGYRCAVCDFSFEDRYGSLGQDFIHVHHTVELSLVPPDYRVNPVSDLRPLCPNCHAMIHRTRPAMSIEELRARVHRR